MSWFLKILIVAATVVVSMGAGAIAMEKNKPIIISHRGASGILPEHTLPAYEKAMEQGTDFVEPDLVITKDGHLVARHDVYLSTTTNVAEKPEFADRKTFIPLLGRQDWLVYDFTLAELKSLRAIQPRDGRDKSFDGLYKIPTFQEIISLVRAHNEKTGENIGIYPETKKPEIFAEKGLDFAKLLLAEIDKAKLSPIELPMFIQSFNVDLLVEIAPHTAYPLIYLLEDDDQQDLIDAVRPHVGILAGLGPDKTTLMRDNGTASEFMLQAHQWGLKLHPWTFRDDDIGDGFKTAQDEYLSYFHLGIDGMFTDFTDTGVRLRQKFLEEQGK